MSSREWLSNLKDISGVNGVDAVIEWFIKTDETECKLTAVDKKYYSYVKQLIDFYKEDQITTAIIRIFTPRKRSSPEEYENLQTDFVIFQAFRNKEKQDNELEEEIKELTWSDICKTNRFYKRFIEEGIEEGIDDDTFKPILKQLLTICYNDIYLSKRYLSIETLTSYIEKLNAIKVSEANYLEKKVAYDRLYERYILDQLDTWLKFEKDPQYPEKLINLIDEKTEDAITNFLLNYPFLNIYNGDKIVKLRKKFFSSFEKPLNAVKEKKYRTVKYLYKIFGTIKSMKRNEDIENDDDAYDHFDNQKFTFFEELYVPKRMFYTYNFRHTILNSDLQDKLSMDQWATIDMILQIYTSDTIGSIISELHESEEKASDIYDSFIKEYQFDLTAKAKKVAIVLKEYRKDVDEYIMDEKGRKGKIVGYDDQDEKMMYIVKLEGNDKIRILDQEEISKYKAANTTSTRVTGENDPNKQGSPSTPSSSGDPVALNSALNSVKPVRSGSPNAPKVPNAVKTVRSSSPIKSSPNAAKGPNGVNLGRSGSPNPSLPESPNAAKPGRSSSPARLSRANSRATFPPASSRAVSPPLGARVAKAEVLPTGQRAKSPPPEIQAIIDSFRGKTPSLEEVESKVRETLKGKTAEEIEKISKRIITILN